MKVLVFFGLFFLVEGATSQTTNGHIVFNIEVTAMDTALETRQSVGLLQESKMELFMAEHKSRLDFKMGELYTTSVILDHTKGILMMLYNGMNGQTASLNNFTAAQFSEPKPDPNMVVIFSDDTRKILGYTCKKAVALLDGEETTYWYTDQIRVEAKGQQIMNPNIPGFPMAFSTTSDGVRMVYQVAVLDLEEQQEDELFSTEVPEGYSILQQ